MKAFDSPNSEDTIYDNKRPHVNNRISPHVMQGVMDQPEKIQILCIIDTHAQMIKCCDPWGSGWFQLLLFNIFSALVPPTAQNTKTVSIPTHSSSDAMKPGFDFLHDEWAQYVRVNRYLLVHQLLFIVLRIRFSESGCTEAVNGLRMNGGTHKTDLLRLP